MKNNVRGESPSSGDELQVKHTNSRKLLKNDAHKPKEKTVFKCCSGCFIKHKRENCKFWSTICFNCNIKGTYCICL